MAVVLAGSIRAVGVGHRRGLTVCRGRKEGLARHPTMFSRLWAHVTGTQVLAGKLEESVNGALGFADAGLPRLAS